MHNINTAIGNTRVACNLKTRKHNLQIQSYNQQVKAHTIKSNIHWLDPIPSNFKEKNWVLKHFLINPKPFSQFFNHNKKSKLQI
ncbi:hypothetical protein C1H46_001016 [Malus baccata]|uniref:Uncharacterized protein n=1 Tax=Malus baccata TaxID=106549 RepID=A0A540NR10_MALBA|nr:hypothetical protein C1H46_001016 [Malus baccata]